MKKRSKWIWIDLPSGGKAKVRSDVKLETIQALDALMTAVAAQYIKEHPEAGIAPTEPPGDTNE